MDLRLHQIWYSSVHAPLRTSPDDIDPRKKRKGKICSVISNSSRHCRILLKFDTLLQYRCQRAAKLWKATLDQIQDGGRHPLNLLSLDHYNSAADCSILFIFDTEFDHVTTNVQQKFKIKRSRSRSQSDAVYQQ